MGWLNLNSRTTTVQALERPESSDGSYFAKHRSTASIASDISIAIPDGLSFDKIIDDAACPPCTLRDFMNFLLFVEHSAENLQFYLWHRSYTQRFSSATPPEMALAPEWTQEQQDEAFAKVHRERREGAQRNTAIISSVLRAPDVAKDSRSSKLGSMRSSEKHLTELAPGDSNPFSTPPATPLRNDDLASNTSRSDAATWKSLAEGAFAAAGIQAPFTIQPFRSEIDRVIATYIMDDAPRQLNLSGRERKQLLIALSHTTHPTAFRQVIQSIEASLRQQAHPNFIRRCIRNGSPSRIQMAGTLGMSSVIGGIIAYIILCLSSVPRGYRALPAILLVIGVAGWWASHQGVCIIMHGVRRRQLDPWEIFGDEDVEMHEDDASSSIEKGSLSRFSSFGSANSYIEKPWEAKYQKRSVLRKMFEKDTWIQEPALRGLQDKIFMRALLRGIIVGGLLTVLFVCVPGGHFF